MLRGLRRPRCNPSRCARSEEADAARIDRARVQDRGDSADRVRRDEIEVPVDIGAALSLRQTHPALVVGEERDPIAGVGRDERAVGQTRLLPASVQPDDRRVVAVRQRQIQRSGQASAAAGETDSHLAVIAGEDRRSQICRRAWAGCTLRIVHRATTATRKRRDTRERCEKRPCPHGAAIIRPAEGDRKELEVVPQSGWERRIGTSLPKKPIEPNPARRQDWLNQRR